MIESQTPAVQLACLAKSRIAVAALQRFAEREDTITAEQAGPIDTALAALSAALSAAGVGAPVDPLKATVSNDQTVVVKTSDGATVSGVSKAKVAGSALTNIALPTSVAAVTSGEIAGIAATGTGTKVSLAVSGGKITAITLSA